MFCIVLDFVAACIAVKYSENNRSALFWIRKVYKYSKLAETRMFYSYSVSQRNNITQKYWVDVLQTICKFGV